MNDRPIVGQDGEAQQTDHGQSDLIVNTASGESSLPKVRPLLLGVICLAGLIAYAYGFIASIGLIVTGHDIIHTVIGILCAVLCAFYVVLWLSLSRGSSKAWLSTTFLLSLSIVIGGAVAVAGLIFFFSESLAAEFGAALLIQGIISVIINVPVYLYLHSRKVKAYCSVYDTAWRDDQKIANQKMLQSALLGSALYLAFFTGMTLFNMHPPQLPPVIWAIITPVTTVAYLLILVYTIRLICRLSLTARLETLVMVVALFAFVVINPTVRDVIWGLLNGERLEKIFARLGSVELTPTLSVLVPFFLILFGVYFGQLLTRIIREVGMLVPVSIIAGLIDFWGVYWGPVGNWSEQAPGMVNMATAATAAAATPEHVMDQMPQLQIFSNISPPQTIGIGDFVFLAFFLACAYRLGFSARRTMWGIFFGLLASVLVMSLNRMVLFGHEISIEYLPGLIFICGGALLANLRSWRLSRQEWAMTGVLTAILLAFIGVTVVRAEMGKPQLSRISFSLTAGSKEALVTSAIERSLKDLRPPGDTLVPFGGFRYAVIRKQPKLMEWQLAVLVRPSDSRRGILQIDISGVRVNPETKEWHIFAERLWKRRLEKEELAQVRATRGVPVRAFTLVDQVETMPATGKDRTLVLVLTFEKMVLKGEQHILKEYDVKQFAGQ